MSAVTEPRALAPHPYADKFPMLPESELADLAESIRANGLRQPVVVTEDGLILDGRNRAAACAMIGIEPEVVVYKGDDLAEYVIDSNVTRRNMSTGARAMATALVLAEDGRRENGRWRRGSLESANQESLNSDWKNKVTQCGVVLDYCPDDAHAVVIGEVALYAAYQRAASIRRSAEADKVRERELRKRQREEEQAEAERNAQIVADLTEAEQHKYLSLIESGDFTPAEAWGAYQEATRKERQHAKELDDSRRRTATYIAESIRYLEGGAERADAFVADVLPHIGRYLAEPMQPTGERIDSAIEYLTTLRKAIR